MITCPIAIGLEADPEHIGKSFFRLLDIGSWSNNLRHFSFDNLPRRRISGLLCDRNLVPMSDQLGNIFIHAMKRDPRHRHRMFVILIFTREDQVENLIADLCIFKKRLIKISDTEKQNTVGVLSFDLEVLLDGGSEHEENEELGIKN